MLPPSMEQYKKSFQDSYRQTFTHLPLLQTRHTQCRMQHGWYHGMHGVLAWNGQRCLQNCDQLTWMCTQKIAKGAKARAQTVSSQKPTGVHRVGHTQRIAQNDKRQPICWNHDRSIFQAHTCNANLKNQGNAYCVHLIQIRNCTIKDMRLFMDRQWHPVWK